VANVVPITFDQPTAGEAGEADGSQDSDNGGYPSPGFPMNCCPPEGWGPYTFLWAGDFSPVPQPTDDGTGFDGQPADDSGSDDIPSVDPISPETPSEPGNDADPVGAVPSEELPAGGDTVATEDFPLVFDDTGMPDPSNTEEMPRCGNDFEDLGPVYPVGADTGFKDADGSDEIAVDEVPVEYQSDDAANEAQPVDA